MLHIRDMIQLQEDCQQPARHGCLVGNCRGPDGGWVETGLIGLAVILRLGFAIWHSYQAVTVYQSW
jgi:hypothetical protein